MTKTRGSPQDEKDEVLKIYDLEVRTSVLNDRIDLQRKFKNNLIKLVDKLYGTKNLTVIQSSSIYNLRQQPTELDTELINMLNK